MSQRPVLSQVVASASALLLSLGLGACEPEEELPDQPDPGGPSACGDPVRGLELTFLGAVSRADGGDLREVAVELEDRSTQPATILGRAAADQEGLFTLEGEDITDWPNCWLTLLDYHLVATAPGLEGSLKVNREMQAAIRAEEEVVDLAGKTIGLSAE